MLKKLAYFLRNLQTSQGNNLRVLGDKKKQNFHCIVFVWTQTYRVVFKSALMWALLWTFHITNCNCVMHILSVKNLFVLICSLLNNWNYFWNRCCNFPFLAICRSLLPLLIFLASSWYQKAKIGPRMIL